MLRKLNPPLFVYLDEDGSYDFENEKFHKARHSVKIMLLAHHMEKLGTRLPAGLFQVKLKLRRMKPMLNLIPVVV